MTSGSGFGNSTNMTESNETFDCRLSEQSSMFITNNTHWEIVDGEEAGTIVIGVLILLFFLVGTIWNSFIIITFFAKRHLLQEPANIFLLNVAITDLLLCMTTMVFSFVTAFGQEYILGNNDVSRCAVCNLDGFFFVFLILLSLHLLAALSVDRFILLSRPLRYKRFMNRWKAIVICVSMYVVCFILAILPIIGFGQYDFNARLAACIPRFTPARNFFYVVFTAVEALIPITVVAITNVWTYRLVSKFLKKNFRRKSTYRRREVEEASGSGNSEGRKHQKQQKQLVKVFGALLIGNIISYTPTVVATFLFLILLLNDMDDLIPAEVYILGFLSFLTSAVIHPIVESFFVKELRYQVNRARKGVRRVSTTLYKQTTQLFSNKTLEEAEKKADDKSTPKTQRKIKFLNGSVVESTTVTETYEMSTTGNSHSPEPLAIKLEEGGEDSAKREKPMLDKTRKSVSFQENPRNRINSNQSVSSQGADTPTVSCMKRLPSLTEEPTAAAAAAEVEADDKKGNSGEESGKGGEERDAENETKENGTKENGTKEDVETQ